MKNKMQYISWNRRHLRLPLRYFFSNRKVKDRLFCYIFEQDRKALLQLYNYLNGTDYKDEHALQIVTLDNVVYMSMNNDIAFLITGNLNLYEHQSTVCPNLPLRFLLYIAAEYEGLVARMRANIYGRTLIPLPQPHCVVFYNGDDEMEDEQYLYLSDAYTEKQNPRDAPCLDLKVRVLNINHSFPADMQMIPFVPSMSSTVFIIVRLSCGPWLLPSERFQTSGHLCLVSFSRIHSAKLRMSSIPYAMKPS